MASDLLLYLHALWHDPEQVLRFPVAGYVDGNDLSFGSPFLWPYSVYRVATPLYLLSWGLSRSAMTLDSRDRGYLD